ncbi:Phospholipase B [Giardia muris]|uniref:Phospholipase B-like n=1 Tax=Giardia muris TaxID=5742 RepID=A0A4Z1SZX6_GIAMU|nr:Phospholipase B [Giardia muris]|eukprot:TNJ26207.1 Phospholipase B [Giardia muris]
MLLVFVLGSLARELFIGTSADGTFTFSETPLPNAVVRGHVVDDRQKTGAQRLYLSVLSDAGVSLTDPARGYYLGFAEGYLLAASIADHFANVAATLLGSDGQWLERHRIFAQESMHQLEKNYHAFQTDPFWVTVYALGHRYVTGLADGYAAAGFPRREVLEFYLLASLRELDFSAYETTAIETAIRGTGCFRITDDLSDVLGGHTTWMSYGYGFDRVLKAINYNFREASTREQLVVFSSQPGVVGSSDSFYVTSSTTATARKRVELVVLDTLYPRDKEAEFSDLGYNGTGVPAWLRGLASNLLAIDGTSWAEHFRRNRAEMGYGNWLVMDYARLREVQAFAGSRDSRYSYITENEIRLLTSVEAIREHILVLDATPMLLTNGLYVSINTPLNNVTRAYLNLTSEMLDADPRYGILLRDGMKVRDSKDMFDLMRHNDYLHDVEANNDPAREVAARYDLRPNEDGMISEPYGAVDTKVVSLARMDDTSLWMAVGPTLGTRNSLPRFKYADWEDVPHHGISTGAWPISPDAFLFGYDSIVESHVRIGPEVVIFSLIFALGLGGVVVWVVLIYLRSKRQPSIPLGRPRKG